MQWAVCVSTAIEAICGDILPQSHVRGDTDSEVNVSRRLAPLDVWLMFALNLSKLGGTGLASAASGQEEPAFAP